MIALINIGDIEPPLDGVVDKTREDYKDFVESVRERGILMPVTVAPRGDKYKLVTGLMRYHASLDCNLETIPAQVYEMTDNEILETQIIQCTHKVVTDRVQYAKQLQRLLLNTPINELAVKLGKTESWVKEHLNDNGIC